MAPSSASTHTYHHRNGMLCYREPYNVSRASDAKMHTLCVRFRFSRETSRPAEEPVPPQQSQMHLGQKYLVATVLCDWSCSGQFPRTAVYK